jgi:hypothetical protein
MPRTFLDVGYLLQPEVILALLIATLGGTAVGLERQWSGHAEGPSARFGGIRTFTMLGALSGLSGWSASLELAVLSSGSFRAIAGGTLAAMLCAGLAWLAF